MIYSTLCYIRRGNDYLMLHRIKKENDANKDKWIGIGGRIEDGESPEQCILREAKEETGIALDPACGRIVATEQWSDSFCDIWLFRQNFDVSAVTLQEGETTAAMAAPIEQILQMERAGEFVPFTPALRRVIEQELK